MIKQHFETVQPCLFSLLRNIDSFLSWKTSASREKNNEVNPREHSNLASGKLLTRK